MSGTIFHPFVLDNAAGQETVLGIGSDSVKYGVGISSDTHVTGIQTVTGFLHAGGGIKDSSGNIGSSGKVLSSTGSGLAWIDPSEGSTANAVNVGTNLNSTNADQFVAFMGASSGNNPVRVDAGLKYNPSTNVLNGGSIIATGGGNLLKLNGTDSTAPSVDLTIFTHDTAGATAEISLNARDTSNVNRISKIVADADGDNNVNLIFHTDNQERLRISGTGNIIQSGTSNYIRINGGLQDKDGQDGDSGQVLSSTGSQVNWINVGDISAGSASQVAVSDESADQTCFPLFVTTATGNQSPKSGSNLTFNSSTGQLNATKFVGDGSGLTNLSTLNQSTTGNAATATALQTARNIAGTSFDGSASIDISYNNLTNKPTIPTNNNQLTNGAGYVTSAGAVPTGTIVAYGGNSAPSGWQLCNGGTASTSALQTLLGQSTVPDLRDRFIIGAGNSYSRHNTGGESSKTLGTANLPSHTHTDGTLSAANVSLTGDIQKISECYNVAGTASGVFTKKGTGNSPVTGSSSNSPTAGVDFDASHSHDVTGNTGDQGGAMGQSFNILPPYYALVFIIKT